MLPDLGFPIYNEVEDWYVLVLVLARRMVLDCVKNVEDAIA